MNYSISITKNVVNDPKSYILQAGCLSLINEDEAASKVCITLLWQSSRIKRKTVGIITDMR